MIRFAMKAIGIGPALLLLCVACGPVTSRAPIKSTPEEAAACASNLLGSMGYDVLDQNPVRAERAKHAAIAGSRADYDRVTVAVDQRGLRVRGETVAVSGSAALGRPTAPMGSPRGGIPSGASAAAIAGGSTMTWPSKELRADVHRLAAECGGE
jgi:hypothetical protein